MKLTKELKNEYEDLYSKAKIKLSKVGLINYHVHRLVDNKDRYQKVAKKTGVPWWMIAVIHVMESGANFNTHLHNGDSLKKRTTQVPRGRPLAGKPPFGWEESAIDAIKYDRLHKWKEWDIGSILFLLEGFNGWGYRKYHTVVKSPYLWSFTDIYTRGKYVADGKWSNSIVSKQCGAVSMLKTLEEEGHITLGGPTEIAPDKILKLTYAEHKIPFADRLQELLNNFEGIDLVVDSWPGKKTSSAFKKVFGMFMMKDTRLK